MLLNFYFFTVKISKRKYSNEEIVRAYEWRQQEARLESTKAKQYDHLARIL